MRSWFSRLFHRRDVRLSGFHSLAEWAGVETAAGIIVTPERALTVPSVYACISVLSQDVAKTPIKLRQRVGPDSFIDATDHPIWEILHALPNPEHSAYEFKLQMMFDLLMFEHAYAEIVRVDGRVSALWRLDPTRMVVDRDAARRKRYRYTAYRGESMEWLFDASRPPIFELSHPSPLRHCRDLIGTALALQHFVGRFFSNGARLGGVLQTDRSLSHDSVERLRQTFESWHGGTDNAHRTAVLEEGLKYQAISAAPDDSQLNETQQTLRGEICGVFRVPTWKVGDLSKATYSNMESGAIRYVTGALDPYFACWEHAIRRDLLTVRQYGQFDVIFDRSALIRSDAKAQHDAFAVGRQNGFYSANDIRRKLGENPIGADAGGDLYLVNGNMTPATDAGQQGQGNGQ